MPQKQPLIAVSRCLLGDPVRYDAADRRDALIADELGRHFRWLPICPEVEFGLGAPRPKIQLEPANDNAIAFADGPSIPKLRLVMPQTARDLTVEMTAHCRRLVQRLERAGVAGCILKSRSPSCGLSQVKVFYSDGSVRREGVGLFAWALQEMLPDLPVVDDEQLHDHRFCEEWLRRIFDNV